MMFYNLVHLGARPDDHCKCVLSMKTVTAFKESYLKNPYFAEYFIILRTERVY